MKWLFDEKGRFGWGWVFIALVLSAGVALVVDALLSLMVLYWR